MALSKEQKNSLIEKAGASPPEFRLFDQPQYFGFQVAHLQSESAFSLDGATRGNRYTPPTWFGQKRTGADPELQWEVEAGDWHGVLDNVRVWIREIARYQDTPDLWELSNTALRTSVEDTPDNEPFTPEERDDLAERLDQVMAKLIEMSERQEATAADVRGIKETVDYLKDASGRLGKKDWALVLIGQAATYAAPLGRVILGHMLHLPPAPPSLPM